MLAKDLITDDVFTLRTSDTAQYAMKMMEELKLSHLPIVNNVEYLGLISENDIFSLNKPKEHIGNHPLSLKNAFVNHFQHIFDVMTVVSEYKLSLLPVVDEKNRFLGAIRLTELLSAYTNAACIENPGGIIILELNENDYSLTQISQIIESNDARILNCYITTHPHSTKIHVTIKTNKIDITPVLQTFERYAYLVIASYSEEFTNSVQDRYDSLMNYLNV